MICKRFAPKNSVFFSRSPLKSFFITFRKKCLLTHFEMSQTFSENRQYRAKISRQKLDGVRYKNAQLYICKVYIFSKIFVAMGISAKATFKLCVNLSFCHLKKILILVLGATQRIPWKWFFEKLWKTPRKKCYFNVLFLVIFFIA